ncbi:hypothetical protein ACN47E_000321 [Coniothyrium glycines]
MDSSHKEKIKHLLTLQDDIKHQPYSITRRLTLAHAYKSLGYPDLAAGDAYKALLLIDEVTEETEYHDEAMMIAQIDILRESMAGVDLDSDKELPETPDEQIISWARSDCLFRAYDLLIACLLDCSCLRSAHDYILRALEAFPDGQSFKEYRRLLSKKLSAHFEADENRVNSMDIDEYPDKGLVRRENYPWNAHEPDRYSVECLDHLAEELKLVAPKLEVRVAQLPALSSSAAGHSNSSQIKVVKQLGLFAKEDISPGERVLEEKSLLTAISRLHDKYCDACSILLPDYNASNSGEGTDALIIACEDCDEVFFCSTDCHDLAQHNYHPALCGINLNQGKVPAREAADNLYTLLLVRALALAQTREIHPLDLKEIRYIWGDYHGFDLDLLRHHDPEGQSLDSFGAIPRSLPFSFTHNVLTPLHVLEKMDVNIYTESHRYDTWIFNILFAKFRGTASAQQGLDGRPEIGAIHPMWCLANHSCDPNVAWEWQGSMRFWAREHLVAWKGQPSSKAPGLRAGNEVLSHYCDVNLPVKERREWAIGALGGQCVCQRCVWEANA